VNITTVEKIKIHSTKQRVFTQLLVTWSSHEKTRCPRVAIAYFNTKTKTGRRLPSGFIFMKSMIDYSLEPFTGMPGPIVDAITQLLMY
jgi:hypothetical protein